MTLTVFTFFLFLLVTSLFALRFTPRLQFSSGKSIDKIVPCKFCFAFLLICAEDHFIEFEVAKFMEWNLMDWNWQFMYQTKFNHLFLVTIGALNKQY